MKVVSRGNSLGTKAHMFHTIGAAFHSKPSFHSRSSSSSVFPTTNPLVDSFEIRLAEDIADLQKHGEEPDNKGSATNYMSFKWLSRALELCLDTHSRVDEMFPLIQKAVMNNMSKGTAKCKVEKLLEDTLELLEVAEALRESFEEVKEYRRSLESVVTLLTRGTVTQTKMLHAQSALDRKKDGVKLLCRLEKCTSCLRKIGERVFSLGEENTSGFLEVINASMSVTVFVCGMLVSALSFKSKRGVPAPPCCGISAWSSALRELYQKVKEETEQRRRKGCCSLMGDLESADFPARRMCIILGSLLSSKKAFGNKSDDQILFKCVETLQTSVSVLGEGIVSLENQVDRLFRVLILTRMALLELLTCSQC